VWLRPRKRRLNLKLPGLPLITYLHPRLLLAEANYEWDAHDGK
jgi:hypothetical protein